MVYAAYLMVSEGVTAMTASQTPAPSPAIRKHDVYCRVNSDLPVSYNTGSRAQLTEHAINRTQFPPLINKQGLDGIVRHESHPGFERVACDQCACTGVQPLNAFLSNRLGYDRGQFGSLPCSVRKQSKPVV